jgi:hypothetical protein
LYYRLAWVRTISNEQALPEEVISLGSETIAVRLVDMFNPAAPVLAYDAPTNKLSWGATANKGTYYLYQQNAKGNWQKIYTVQQSSANQALEYTLPGPLSLNDSQGNRIYYRFKVAVQNNSGLLNLTDNIITV